MDKQSWVGYEAAADDRPKKGERYQCCVHVHDYNALREMGVEPGLKELKVRWLRLRTIVIEAIRVPEGAPVGKGRFDRWESIRYVALCQECFERNCRYA